jgi:hypothetical protein
MCQPNGPLLRELIEKRGYTVSGFARMIRRAPAVRSAGRPPSVRSIWRAIEGHPMGIEYIRPVARGLRVKPSEISDWDGDDDIWDDPEIKIPA